MKKFPPKKSAPRERPRREPRESTPPPPAAKETKYHGVNACLAIWKQRPQDVVRIYVDEAVVPRFGELLKWAATQRLAYHVVTRDDLERLTDTTHHGGICMLARDPAEFMFADMRRELRASTDPQLLLYLDGVENPHNFGAILRAAAYFGVNYVVGAAGELPRMSPSTCRVAEGAAETVRVVRLHRGLAELKLLQEDGFALIGSHVQRGQNVYHYTFPRRCILVLGAEEHGMSSKLRNAVDITLRIPGAGGVESLNVASACAVLASEYFRAHASRQATSK